MAYMCYLNFDLETNSHASIPLGVDQIPYSCGKSYIIQTRRSIQPHLREHITNAFHSYLTKSTIIENSHNIECLIYLIKL